MNDDPRYPPPSTGTDVPGTGMPPPGGEVIPVPIETADERDVAENKAIAAIAYLGPLVFVALLLGRQSPYARYHLNQGLVLAITWGVCWVVGLVLDVLLALIPIVGWIVGACIPLTLFVGWLFLAVTGVLNAVNGRVRPLPGIGKAFRVLS